MLASWAAREPRIVVLTLEKNSGIPAALNHGLAAARGEFIARHDADDVFVSGRLGAQVAVLESDPRTVLVSGNFDIIDTRGRCISKVTRTEPPEVTAYLLHFSNFIGGHAQVMYRRTQVLALGGYDDHYAYSEDYDLWTRLAPHGRIVILPKVMMKHRVHKNRVSFVMSERQRNRSVAITRRMLTALLDRELTDEEMESVVSVWRLGHRPHSARVGHRVLVEAYHHFIRTNTNREHRRRVRIVTASRWVVSAAHFARAGRFGQMFRHLGYAALWHPLGILAGTALVARSAAVWVRYHSSWAHSL
jgi:glycosyltransferase involved in cell wall biosynthesis